MTIKEALTTKLKRQLITISDEDMLLLLSESKLIGTDDYDIDLNGKVVDLALAGLFLEIAEISEVKEDDVSIKYSRKLKDAYSAIMRKWGLADPFAAAKPSVRQLKGFW